MGLVSVGRPEWLPVREQAPHPAEGGDLVDLRLALDELGLQRPQHGLHLGGGDGQGLGHLQEDGAEGHGVGALPQRGDVLPSHVRLADGSGVTMVAVHRGSGT